MRLWWTADVMDRWCNLQLVVWAFIVTLLLSSLWLIWNNCVCKLPASYTSTASYISKRPITPGLLYLIFSLSFSAASLCAPWKLPSAFLNSPCSESRCSLHRLQSPAPSSRKLLSWWSCSPLSRASCPVSWFSWCSCCCSWAPWCRTLLPIWLVSFCKYTLLSI